MGTTNENILSVVDTYMDTYKNVKKLSHAEIKKMHTQGCLHGIRNDTLKLRQKGIIFFIGEKTEKKKLPKKSKHIIIESLFQIDTINNEIHVLSFHRKDNKKSFFV